jgi:hypothetical protein
MDRLYRFLSFIRTLLLRSILSCLTSLGRKAASINEQNKARMRKLEREGKVRPPKSAYVPLEEAESGERDALMDRTCSEPPHLEITRPTYQIVGFMRTMSPVLTLVAIIALAIGSERAPTVTIVLLLLTLFCQLGQLLTHAMLPAIHKYGITRVGISWRIRNYFPRQVVLVCPPLSGPVARRSQKERRNSFLLDFLMCINVGLALDSRQDKGEASAKLIEIGTWCCFVILYASPPSFTNIL